MQPFIDLFLTVFVWDQVYHPGGVKYASQLQVNEPGKESLVTGDLDVPWVRVDVRVTGLGLKWIRPSFGPLIQSAEKVILEDVNVSFPAGQVTAILVCQTSQWTVTVIEMMLPNLVGPEWRRKINYPPASCLSIYESRSPSAFQV